MTSRNNFTLPAVALLVVALSLFASACGRSAESKNKQAEAANATPEVVQVSTAAAITRELPRYTEATGSLAADEQTDVAPNVSGRVVAVGVDLGSYVQRGAVLVRLDDADARLRLTQLQAQAQQAQSAVRQA